MYRAFYRKYRPSTFTSVVGQEHITKTLENAVKSGKTSHAYLFTGSRGTGKTSCAKILSKAVNCLNPIDGNPCNECEICRGIDNGAILDIIEIDAASNNGGAEQAETNFNYALLAMLEGNTTDAAAFLGKAAGVEQLAEAQALLNIQNGEYAKAIENFGNTVSNNAALAQILAKDYNAASNTLANVANPDATTYYLKAVIAARTNDEGAAKANLRQAIALDNNYAARATADKEFAKFDLSNL